MSKKRKRETAILKLEMALVFISMLQFSGCASLATRATSSPAPYAATHADICALRETFWGDENGKYDWTNFIGLPFVLADLPCSAVFDTWSLPMDLKNKAKGNPSCNELKRMYGDNEPASDKKEEVERKPEVPETQTK